MFNKQENKDKKLFNKIAHDYVKKDLVSYCRIARKIRLTQSLKGISKPINKLLEVGCGAGFSANYLNKNYINYLGVDYSKNLIKFANQYNISKNVTFECSNIMNFSSNTKFDVILMIGVLHHMPDPEKVILSLNKNLSDQGVLVVNEPQAGNPFIGFLRSIRKKIDKNYSSDQVEFTNEELCNIFIKCGYKVKSYSQGIFSTPLAETRILPNFVGVPLALISVLLDPFLEKILSILNLKKFTWNIVIHGKKSNNLK